MRQPQRAREEDVLSMLPEKRLALYAINLQTRALFINSFQGTEVTTNKMDPDPDQKMLKILLVQSFSLKATSF